MNKVARRFLILEIIIVALMSGALAWLWKTLPPKIPWFYSLPWGEQQLVDKMVLVFVLAGMLGLLTISRIFSVWAGKDDNTVEIAIMAGSLAATILLAATFFRVMKIFVGI